MDESSSVREAIVIVMLHTLWRNGAMYRNDCERFFAEQLASSNISFLFPEMLLGGNSSNSQKSELCEWQRARSIEQQALRVVQTITLSVEPGTPLILFGYSISTSIAMCAARYLLALRGGTEYPLRGIFLVAPVIAIQSLSGTPLSESSEQRRGLPLLSRFSRNRLAIRSFETQPVLLIAYAKVFANSCREMDFLDTTTDAGAKDPDAVYNAMRGLIRWCPNASAAAIRRAATPVLILDAAKDLLRSNDPQRRLLLRLLGASAMRIVAPRGSTHALITKSKEFVYGHLGRFIATHQR